MSRPSPDPLFRRGLALAWFAYADFQGVPLNLERPDYVLLAKTTAAMAGAIALFRAAWELARLPKR